MTLSTALARTPRRLLTELLDDPDLVSDVQGLAPEALLRLIRHVGLEDAAELAELATVDQLEALFDEDLWVSEQPGDDERFDDDRFALWLSILLESGERTIAEKLAALPDDLVLLGLQRRLLVIDLDQLAVEISDAGDDADLTEKALDSTLYHEFDQYRVIARRHDGWDSVLGVLLALDTHARDVLDHWLERLSALSSEYIEDNGGLYDVLTSEEMLEADVAGEREDRRAAAGYVAPKVAKSFIRLAESTPLEELVASRERDPVTRAYFRDLAPARPVRKSRVPRSKHLRALLRDAGAEFGSVRRLPEGRRAWFVEAMRLLAESSPDVHAARIEELAYVTNVLIGAGVKVRPIDAAELAVRIVEEGVRQLLRGPVTAEIVATLLEQETLDKLFRVGWRSRRDAHVGHPATSAR